MRHLVSVFRGAHDALTQFGRDPARSRLMLTDGFAVRRQVEVEQFAADAKEPGRPVVLGCTLLDLRRQADGGIRIRVCVLHEFWYAEAYGWMRFGGAGGEAR